MEYDVNRVEFVKTQYIIQTSEHIFQICIDCMFLIIYFLKYIFSLCSGMFCEMFYLLRCFTLAELKCFCASPTQMYLLLNTLQGNGFLQMETWLNMKRQIGKRITEHICWGIGVLLTCRIRFCTCDHSTLCVGACECDHMPLVLPSPLWNKKCFVNCNQPNAQIFSWYKVWVFPSTLSNHFLFSFWPGYRSKNLIRF